MPTSREDRSGLILLVSLLILLLVSPFAAEGRRGESIFVLALYGAFAAATIELSQKNPCFLRALVAHDFERRKAVVQRVAVPPDLTERDGAIGDRTSPASISHGKKSVRS